MDGLKKISTGLPGLDEILYGGLIQKRSYLVQGGPGSGKSTLGLHFLAEAIKDNQKALYITLGESEHSIIENVPDLDCDLSQISFLDLSPGSDFSENATSYSVFSGRS